MSRNDFIMPRWFRSPHWQTAGSVIIPRAMTPFPSEDRLFRLPDGSQLVAECSWQHQKKATPTMVVVHGLNGSTISSYVRGVTAKAYAKGLNVVRVDLRNGGNSEKYSKTLSHAGRSDDIKRVVAELIEKDGLAKIGLIAFSFGGNVCLKALGEWSHKTPPEIFGMVGISPLIDLAAAADSIDHKAPAVYQWQILRGLKSSLLARSRLFPNTYNVAPLKGIKTMRDFDNAYAPYNGFKDADDYYAHASALPILTKVTIPTLIIQADDDPVIPAESFSQINTSSINVVITRGGGHAGFISRSKGDDPDRHWAENRAIEYLLNIPS